MNVYNLSVIFSSCALDLDGRDLGTVDVTSETHNSNLAFRQDFFWCVSLLFKVKKNLDKIISSQMNLCYIPFILSTLSLWLLFGRKY